MNLSLYYSEKKIYIDFRRKENFFRAKRISNTNFYGLFYEKDFIRTRLIYTYLNTHTHINLYY